MGDTSEERRDAIASYYKEPGDLGRCLRGLSLLLSAGDAEGAAALARHFATANEVVGRGAEAMVSFARQAPVRAHPAGHALITEGASEDTCYVIIAGEVVVRREGVGEICRMGAGRLCGEVSALLGTRRTASISTASQARVMVLPALALKKLARYVPPVSAWLALTARDRLLPYMMGRSALSVLDRDEQLSLFRRSRPMSFDKGTHLISAGQELKGVGLIVSGRASAWRRDINGRRTVWAVGPGELIVGHDAIAGDHSLTSITTVTPLTWCLISLVAFRELLHRYPGIGARLRRRLPRALTDANPEELLATTPRQEVVANLPEGSVEMNVEERAAFLTLHGGQHCPSCGFPDADIICPACGAAV